MSWLKLGFLDFTDLLFIALFILLFVFFLADFKVTSRRSWMILLAMIGMGGVLVFRAWRRKKLLEEFERREKELEKLEKEYEELKNKAKITEEAYKKATEDLERAKVEAGLALMRLDKELAKKIEEIEKEYEHMSVDESIKKIKEALGS
ncbi:MAG: hypothetical protein D6814_00845 [Calditrichaeota bacterium]|nr:MAG: hypothetical protein D6814_00845 [Calditrichota bacterium]